MEENEIRASEAKQVLESPRLQEAFDNVREGIVSQLEAVPLGDDRLFRDELVISLQLLQTVKADLQRDIDTLALDSE